MLRLDGFGIFVDDFPKMITFYKDILGFEIKEDLNTNNVYLIKDQTLFLMFGKSAIQAMLDRKLNFAPRGVNGHFEIALHVDTYDEVDQEYERIKDLVKIITKPETMPWGQRTFYFADPEGNLIEIGSFNQPFRS